ncbi:HDOD domain-containing protein [Thermodesulfatator indicus]
MGLLNFLKKKKNPREELRKKLKNFELPYLPRAALLALEAIRDPKTSVKDIAQRVAADPGLHLKVLRTVNSAAFGLPRQVNNIEHAVALLGRARLESLLLPLAVKEALPPINTPCLDYKLFWLTAAKRGTLARKIAHALHPHYNVEAFSAGLLQDIAIPVILNTFHEKYCPVIDTWNNDPEIEILEIEKKTLGYDHQNVGHLMAEEWELPAYLTEAIAKHHFPEVEPGIFLSSFLKYNKETSQIEREIIIELAKEKFNLAPDAVNQMISQTEKEAQELAHIFL